MATETDICNLALANLGDEATVASIDPPEGSAQAWHCSRFYAQARDYLLEIYPWVFATTRADLSLLDEAPLQGWAYAYAVPSDALRILAVLEEGATDTDPPVAYETEERGGTLVIYTDAENAVVRYIRQVTDTAYFAPSFIDALVAKLESMLAGPLLKGSEGRAASKAALSYFLQVALPAARAADASQRHVDPRDNPNNKPAWIAAR